jgi:hypothetical protein
MRCHRFKVRPSTIGRRNFFLYVAVEYVAVERVFCDQSERFSSERGRRLPFKREYLGG